MLRLNRLRPLASRIRFASSNSEIEDLTKSNKSFRSDVKQVHHFDTMLNYDDFFGVLDKVSWQDLAINRLLKKEIKFLKITLECNMDIMKLYVIRTWLSIYLVLDVGLILSMLIR